MLSRLLVFTFALASLAVGAPSDPYPYATFGSGGVSATWIFANIAYTGMRAQANPSFFGVWSLSLRAFPEPCSHSLLSSAAANAPTGLTCLASAAEDFYSIGRTRYRR
jgi:hypothetical protein